MQAVLLSDLRCVDSEDNGKSVVSIFDVLGGICTLLWYLGPFWVWEFILAHPDPSFHPWRNSLACVGVKWREATQPKENEHKKSFENAPLEGISILKSQNIIYSLVHNALFNLCHTTLLTRCTWWRPGTTYRMTYHTSLDPKPQELIRNTNKSKIKIND